MTNKKTGSVGALPVQLSYPIKLFNQTHCLTQQNKFMQSNVISNGFVKRKGTKIYIFFLCFLLPAARLFSQTITLSLKEQPIEKVFKTIEEQTAFQFIYSEETIRSARPVTLQLNKVSLKEAMDKLFSGQPLSYSIADSYIIVKAIEGKVQLPAVDVTGKVTDEAGEGLAGVTVMDKRSLKSTYTRENGEFILKDVDEEAVLVFSYVGRETVELPVAGKNSILVRLPIVSKALDETIIQAYGTTTRRLNTGNISRVTADEIGRQPVSNPILALEGRVPGLLITQMNGINGAGVKIQLRGQNSLLQGSDPFFIIDGVPFGPGNDPLNLLTNATGVAGLSPFNLLNPADIESIEILKDADATAIYGSRAANGIVLITTKKGRAGKTRVNAKVYSGWSKATRTVHMLNTGQYLQVRREAFQNDGIALTSANAPDLLVWDSTRYTDFWKLLAGGTQHSTDAQLSVSGGNEQTQFFLGMGFHKETTVLPTDLADKRSSVHLSLTHSSTDKKFLLNFSGSYSSDINKLAIADLTAYIRWAPNFKLYDSTGNLNWAENGVSYKSIGLNDPNPLLFFKRRFNGEYQDLNSRLNVSYFILPTLSLKVNLGYNFLTGDETAATPGTSIDPNSGVLPSGSFGNSDQKSWIVEPQLEYKRRLGKAELQFLAGTTFQENTSHSITIVGSNYSSDILLNSISGAGSVTASNSYTQYSYDAMFGRVNVNFGNKYLANLSGRRDGSSRFGPGRQFANFGAVGSAGIFTNEKLVKEKFKGLNFGKFRFSYGITGNDQIGNYKYLDTWTASSSTYQGGSSLNPTSLFNPEYAWEINRKLEVGLDLGFLHNRLLFSAAAYKNRSGNQLVSFTLPTQTGFASIGKNLDALIQNKGLEIEATSKNIIKKQFTWSTTLTVTINRNKLLTFPGLASSSYASTYIIGEPLSARAAYQYLGVDPLTGLYRFTDMDSNGIFNTIDRVSITHSDPEYYGGFLSALSYGQFELDIFFQFRKQKGRSYLDIAGVPANNYFNFPTLILDRWQKPGDLATVQKYTASTSSQAAKNASTFRLSDGVYTDASYIRCQNLAVDYNFPSGLAAKLKIQSGRFYLQAQNLFTITNYKSGDPESQNMFSLPPLKTLSAGIEINL
jgi:TonB-dependent starch-binding outer membrane protein SusC